MLTIVCGEDTVASRNYFHNLKEEYKKKGYELVVIPKADVDTIQAITAETASLFAQSRVFFSEGLVKHLKRSKSKATLSKVSELMKRDMVWFDWEEYAAREITNPKGAIIKEFKPATTVFKLLEYAAPGKKKQFLHTLATLSADEGFVYAMLCKHIRMLLLIKTGSASAVPAWQRYKLTSQAQAWPLDRLINLYEGLGRLDQTVKTSTNPYGIKKSLDILACYYL